MDVARCTSMHAYYYVLPVKLLTLLGRYILRLEARTRKVPTRFDQKIEFKS